ncbi:MAG: translation initiation factor IF-2 [Coriobacteriales bacterium]|jgi:translation initiation factor IF-2
MAKMRVHELAKEFGVTSKEMLEKLNEMHIPAKNHSSTLEDAYVDKIRKKMAPILEAKKAEEEAKAAAAAEEERKADEAKKAAEEKAAREKAEEESKAAAEAERKKREKDKAARDAELEKRKKDKAARDAELARREKEKAAREASESKESGDQKSGKDQKKKKVLRADSGKSDLDDLLSRIEAESKRLSQEKSKKASQAKKEKEKEASKQEVAAEQASAMKAPRSESKPKKSKQGGKQRAQYDDEQPQRKGGKKGNKRAQRILEEELDSQIQESETDDRYKKMADKAEKLQRQKIIDEAKAMVDAAQNEGQGRRKKRKAKREAQAKKRMEQEAIEKGIDPSLVLDDSVVQITTGSTVAEVADALGVNSSEIIKKLFLLGTPLTVTQSMSDDLIDLIADDLGRKVRIVSPEERFEIAIHDSEEDLEPRPPVVTVMGHVDHGKTSLLDTIRKTGVAETEAGGITQAIGASVVNINGRQITFIDTPGHEAFTAMRARGAKITDVVVLVVAADDGVMPQTIEAINHAKAADVPIVVAVNKIDKPGANPEKVRQELTEYGIIPEEWGGENMFVDVSAKKGINIDELLETILLQADVLELKANPNALASGFVIEANLDKGRGPVATVLVNRGTLKVGDALVAGTAYGRVRALINPKGEHVDSARPADPVEVLGLNSVPAAGDEFRVFDDERDARDLAEDRALRERLKEQQSRVPVTLDDFFNRIEEGKIPELNLVVKADTQGSIEALKDAFAKMDQSEVHINVIHSAVGGVTETDVILAAASDAIIIGFGVRPQAKAKQLAEKEKVDIRTYRIIYKLIEDINAARVGMLKPDIVEVETATLEVRETFKVPKVGTIAGCLVTEGEVNVDNKIRVVRDGTIIHEGDIASLRRFKDDAVSVKAGFECGLGIADFQDIHVGDVLESYELREVAREA